MTFTFRPKPLLNLGLFSLALVAGFSLNQRSALAQSESIYFTQSGEDINSAISTPADDALSVSSSTTGATETFEVWLVVTPGASGAPNSNLGIVNTYWGMRTSTTNNGAFTLPTGSTSGTNTNTGAILTGSAYLKPFEKTSAFASNEFGDRSSDGLNDIGTLTGKTTTALANGDNGASPELGGGTGPNVGEAITSGGWAWEVATVAFVLPTINSTGNGTITLTPAAATFTGLAQNQWTFDGGNTIVSNNTSSADALQIGDSITYKVSNTPPIDTSGTGSFNATVVTNTVANGGSYGGITSQGSTKGANSNTALPGIEGSTATIVGGTNGQGSSMTVSMVWRSRDLNETPSNDSVNGTGWPKGSPTSPPLPNGSLHPLGLISDVVNLYGMSSGSTGVNPGAVTPVATDVFALEMSFNPATLVAEGANGNTQASHGQVYLASLIPFAPNLATQESVASGGTAYWVNTIVGNAANPNGTTTTTATYGMGPNNTAETINVGASAATAMEANTENTAASAFSHPLLESFSAWANTEFGTTTPTTTQLAPFLGVWGVDTSTGAGGDQAWAVIDHNSEFAVVPEPSTIVLAALGLAGMAFSARKRKAAMAA